MSKKVIFFITILVITFSKSTIGYDVKQLESLEQAKNLFEKGLISQDVYEKIQEKTLGTSNSDITPAVLDGEWEITEFDDDYNDIWGWGSTILRFKWKNDNLVTIKVTLESVGVFGETRTNLEPFFVEKVSINDRSLTLEFKLPDVYVNYHLSERKSRAQYMPFRQWNINLGRGDSLDGSWKASGIIFPGQIESGRLALKRRSGPESR